jgi:Ca2+-binding EF-hand superfamily protein
MLRSRIGQLISQVGHQTFAAKSKFLGDYIARWSMGKTEMNFQQFCASLQSLNVPLSGSREVFAALDRDGSGTVDIREFCDAMIGGDSGGYVSPSRGGMGRFASSVMTGPAPGSVYDRASKAAAINSVQNSNTANPAWGSYRGPETSPRRMERLAERSRQQQERLRRGRAAAAAEAKSAARAAAGGEGAHEVDFCHLVVEQFRKVVLQRGGSGGIHSLGRIFRLMDDDGNRQISLPELQEGLDDYGLRMGPKDIALLVQAIDRDGSGALSFDEFMLAVRGAVSERRRRLISMAFDVLDRTGDGSIMLDDIRASFDCKHHPDVLSGKMSEEQALGAFLRQFDTIKQDGCVSREEFIEYYKNVSASIDSDDYFELMIRNAWHIPGGVGQFENTANTRVCVTFADGSQKVVMIENDLGLDKGSDAALKAALKAQGVKNVVKVETSG